MIRKPHVAGRFYPGDAAALVAELDAMLGLVGEKRERHTIVAMVPHAGYVFSGSLCGATLSRANLSETILMLGPNHTGLGTPMSLWGQGGWAFPGGSLAVDEELAGLLLDGVDSFEADTQAHATEHSLEVIVPFLHRLNPSTRIVPVAISDPDPNRLLDAGKQVAEVLKSLDKPVSMVVSSDMSHFISDEEARKRDALAVEAALTLDPAQLWNTVRTNDISMCGVLPMTLALSAAGELGAQNAELVGYTTSADASGDYGHVVGYAGIVVD